MVLHIAAFGPISKPKLLFENTSTNLLILIHISRPALLSHNMAMIRIWILDLDKHGHNSKTEQKKLLCLLVLNY